MRYPLILAVILSLPSYSLTHAQVVLPDQLFDASPEVQAGQLLIQRGEDEPWYPSLHLETDISVAISGMIATITMQQRFLNDSGVWVQGSYVLPLSEGAAVNRMDMLLGERRIVGEIKEKGEARTVFRQAQQSGRKAAITEQQRPNLFSQRVANIPPGEAIEVELSYVQQVHYDGGEFSLRLPTTLTPRYIPGRSLDGDGPLTIEAGGWGWSSATDEVADAQHITPFMSSASTSQETVSNPLTLNVTLDSGLPLARVLSDSHPLVVTEDGDNYRIRTQLPQVAMDRDVILRWQPQLGSQPRAAVFTETVAGEDYLLLMLVPPQQRHATDLPRQVTFVIDNSGSMQGASIVQAKESLLLAIDTLSDQDMFNIIVFNSDFRVLHPAPVAATSASRYSAKRFVRGIGAGGGTAMYPALAEALSYQQGEGLLQQIVFITDGAVGNEQALFRLIHEELADARLFTVGIGSAPNSHFMTKAAEFGRGSYTFINDSQNISENMSSLFRKLESPVLSSIALELPDQLAIDFWPKRIPDLYSGEPLLLAGKTAHPLDAETPITVTGFGTTPWQRELALMKTPQNASPGVATLWARKKIDSLLDGLVMGEPPSGVRAEVLDVALTHRLVSPYTSFVAVEKLPSRPANVGSRNSGVPNLVADGQVPMRQAQFPQTATAGGALLLIGALALMLLLVIGLWLRRPWPGTLYSGAGNASGNIV